MNVHQAASVVHNPITSIILLIATSGAFWTALSVANDLENQVNSTEQRQQTIISSVDEIKNELKERQVQQQEIRDLLIEIKTKVENQ